MSKEQIEQAQQDEDFAAGFNSVRPSDDYQPPEEKEVEPEHADDAEPESDEGSAEPEATDEPEEEKPVLAGLTESQIKNLLQKVTKVDDFEAQLRKAHGKIGELQGKLKEFGTKSQPTQVAPAALDDEQLSAFEAEYPEFAAVAEARARKIAAEMLQGHATGNVQQDIQTALMDTLHDGWRDVVGSQDFSLWLAAQPEAVQQTYSTTENARELGAIVTSFKGWQDGTKSRGARNKQRLEAALTPDGAPSRARQAPTAEDEFAAGFNAVRSTYR